MIHECLHQACSIHQQGQLLPFSFHTVVYCVFLPLKRSIQFPLFLPFFCSLAHKDGQDLGFPLSSPHWLFSVKSLQAENATGPFLHLVCLSSLTPSAFLSGSGDPTDTCNIGIEYHTMMFFSSHGNFKEYLGIVSGDPTVPLNA